MSEKKTVVVALEGATMRQVFLKFLEENGFAAIEAVDGVEVLKICLSQKVDAVFAGLEIPVLNGYSVSRIIKNSRKLSRIRVVLFPTDITTVSEFWANNSLCDDLIEPKRENFSYLLNFLGTDDLVMSGGDGASKKTYKFITKPDAKDLVSLAAEGFENELFDLYLTKNAFHNSSNFNIRSLVQELIKSMQGIIEFDALSIIINTNPIQEYYCYTSTLSQKDFLDFRHVSQTEFEKKTISSRKFEWKKSVLRKIKIITDKPIDGIKGFESFPRSPENELMLAIAVGSENPKLIYERVSERISVLTEVYTKLFTQAVVFYRMKMAEEKMRKAFSRFVPQKIISDIISGGNVENASVGEKREIAVMMTDIRSFTSISEINEPEKVVEFLNYFFSIMGRIIKKHGGIIDKFMGDAIMALFGAPESYPDNAARAAAAASEMHQALKDLKIDLNLPPGYKFAIGTGIHYGPAIVGSIGSDDKKEYTVIGDSVNISSRVEGLTKIYGRSIVITDTVKRNLREEQKTQHIDNVKVKGKSVAIAIYELLQDDLDEDFSINYNKGINQYTIGNFTLAADYFTKAKSIRPDDKATALLLERCKTYAKDKPKNWDGAVMLTTK